MEVNSSRRKTFTTGPSLALSVPYSVSTVYQSDRTFSSGGPRENTPLATLNNNFNHFNVQSESGALVVHPAKSTKVSIMEENGFHAKPPIASTDQQSSKIKGVKRKDVFHLLSQVQELVLKSRQDMSTSLFETSDLQSLPSDNSGELDALKLEADRLIGEKNTLERSQTLSASYFKGELAKNDAKLEDNKKTSKNDLKSTASVQTKQANNKKKMKSLQKSMKCSIDKMDTGALIMHTHLKVSNKYLCTDKSFCEELSSGKCFRPG